MVLGARHVVGGGRQGEDVQPVLTYGELVEVVDGFCYFGDVVRGEGGAEAAVRARISSAWRSWRKLASLLVNLSIPLVNISIPLVNRAQEY